MYTATTVPPTPRLAEKQDVTILVMVPRRGMPDNPEVTALWSIIPARNSRARKRAIAKDVAAHLEQMIHRAEGRVAYGDPVVVGVLVGHCQPAARV